MTARDLLTAERLRELLDYDPETGVFTWRVGRPRVARGSVAGAIRKKGHRQISIDGVLYLAHRLAWFYMTGEWPTDQIDHENGVRDDNRFANLREADNVQNQRNARIRRDNASGLKGVCFHPKAKRWMARIRHSGRLLYLGLFDTAAEAHAAYCKAATERDPEFARFA